MRKASPGFDADPVRTADLRTLFLERAGTGTPVVVFESGMGASRSSWGAIAPAIAERTTAVVYDRSGLGRSGPDAYGRRRDLDRLASDLLEVLDHLGPGPFILVGHSWGGPIIRVAASRRPDAIAGLVLVDVTEERCDLFFSAANARQVRWTFKVLPVLAKLGLLRLAVKRLSRALPADWAATMQAEDGTVDATTAQLRELEPHLDDLRRLRESPPVLPDVPVTYISGTKRSRMEGKRRPGLVAAHEESAAALPQGRHVEAANSSHYVPLTDPQLVIDEITRLL